jgi:hypothetical protein
MGRKIDWRQGRTWRILEQIYLISFLPENIAKSLAQKGILTITDVLEQLITAEEIDSRPISDLGLKSYIESRLISRGFETIGSTDCLTSRQMKVFMSGLGNMAVRDLNEARSRFGKPPIRKL